jgi:hypothetical protein
MDAWRKVWREAVAPLLPTRGLEALRRALERDDPALVQGVTTDPPPLEEAMDRPVQGACAIGHCGWLGQGLGSVAAVEEYFAAVCRAADERLGEPAGIRPFLAFFDDTPRQQMRLALLEEVGLELAIRVRRAG